MMNKWLSGFLLLAAVLLAAFVGETGKINNPGCPDSVQHYKGVICG